MLNEILRYIRNYFPDTKGQMKGKFEIKEGKAVPFPSLVDGQYFLVEGSAMNDGVWNSTEELSDEIFEGVVTPLKIPKDFLALAKEIEEYQTKADASPYVSESFGGYSYTKATDANGTPASWQTAFATRLKTWRKL